METDVFAEYTVYNDMFFSHTLKHCILYKPAFDLKHDKYTLSSIFHFLLPMQSRAIGLLTIFQLSPICTACSFSFFLSSFFLSLFFFSVQTATHSPAQSEWGYYAGHFFHLSSPPLPLPLLRVWQVCLCLSLTLCFHAELKGLMCMVIWSHLLFF